ncbi:hypothetical protein AURANDRAFT_71236 [Aureococcus anophagefferens]|uniref:Uncharacterized protein n=1 Tax=Aureococcus anophagefferens TaxID=44056 RepID=F0Y3A7_AURAN|nr:hypothetical protein AURANDRAFT_71236 [Aureococcus anophagefferens]EGB10227.1 hypothetical protein AURANDRAFT_71236 [Aureococcus anophagefferens]|eukprot:XP_009035044.1 hypothetical protein AURANDRAFT_71236 [Aureococcus anophagefferens]
MAEGATKSLATLPNTVFGVALGLAGNGVLVKGLAADRFWGARRGRAALWVLWAAALATWIALVACLGAKALLHRRFLLREWRHRRRCFFFFVPHVALVALCLGAPDGARAWSPRLFRWCYGLALALQVALCARSYARWVGDDGPGGEPAGVDHATPPDPGRDARISPSTRVGRGDVDARSSAPTPYLLSTVGWPLLSSLAVDLDIEREWGAPLAAWTLGPGVANATARGEPSLFLLMAPPSAASVAMGCGAASDGAFGFAFLLFVVVLRVGPVFLRRPEILGAYWAYTFPLAALATAATHCAKCGRAPEALAWALSSAALAMVVLVAGRMGLHAARVAAGADSWPDPLLAPPKGAEGGTDGAREPLGAAYRAPLAVREPTHPPSVAMSLETWVGLARNGLCVVSDTLPERFDQFGRYANGMSTMNYLIAPLQLAAVVFNVPGALGLPGAALAYARARGAGAAAARSASDVVRVAGARRLEAAWVGLCFAFLKCTLAPAFLVLFLNSCKQAEGWWVEHALLAMQVGLAVALWAMRVDLLAKWGRTHNANVIALIEHDGNDGGRHCAYAEAVCDAGLGGSGDLAAEATLAALLAFAERGKADYDLDVRVWVLNCVAFCGYAVFPLTYFGPFARDPFHEWFGNFAGDLAWTVEPALVLLAASAAKTAEKASKKAD